MRRLSCFKSRAPKPSSSDVESRLGGRHGLPHAGSPGAVTLLIGAAAASAAGDWPTAGERRISLRPRLALPEGRVAGRGAAGVRRRRLARARPAARLGDRGPVRPEDQPAPGLAARSSASPGTASASRVPAASGGRSYAIELDGAMSNATVFLNGHELGGRPYGYIGFAVDLTPHLHLRRRRTCSPCASRPRSTRRAGIPGAGIYRHVWIDATGPVHVARWGTFVTTPAVSDAQATVSVRTDLQNREAAAGERRRSRRRSLDADGREVARTSTRRDRSRRRDDGRDRERHASRSRTRWDVEHPYLYTAVSTVKRGTRVLDRYATPFGIRTIEWGPTQGLRAERPPRAAPGRVRPPRPGRARERPSTAARSSASSRS